MNIIAENVIGSMKVNESGDSILNYGQRYCVVSLYYSGSAPLP